MIMDVCNFLGNPLNQSTQNENHTFNNKYKKLIKHRISDKSAHEIKFCNCIYHNKKPNKFRGKKEEIKHAKINKRENALNNKKPKLIKFEAEKTRISNEENNIFIKSENYSFKGQKTLQNKEISFDIIAPQIKNQIKPQKENIDDIQFYDSRKQNNIIRDKNDCFKYNEPK